ncbi:autotransporter outer membrane beta-barrel domain-containing protein [Actibacterium ureilyticum]|uniref:autotransporter outer membrane beta-barrel domain-containing protein n=1 Tax=Actibacterium ureilyticum TaxID=1590614 RepID=UPI000BAAA745|nr:autotransporter outer membrane beta-barrel domain-containing protein [Actibacterium ureilyticum]
MLNWFQKNTCTAVFAMLAVVAGTNPAAAVTTTMTAIVNATGGDDTFTFEYSPGPSRVVTTTGGTGAARSVNPSVGSSTATTGNPPATPAPLAVTVDIVLPAGWTLSSISCDIPVAPAFETPPVIDTGAGRVTFASPDYDISLPAEVAPRRRQCTFNVTKDTVPAASATDTSDLTAETGALLAATALPVLVTGPRTPYLRNRLTGAGGITADVTANRGGARLSTRAITEDNGMAAWADLSAAELKLGSGAEGRSHVVSAGVDLLLRPDLLLGLMVVADDYKADDSGTGYTADAHGAMIGPYFAKAYGGALVLDGRLLYGQGAYSLSPDGRSEGEFDASRLLAQLRLSGTVTRGAWDIQPSADLLYFRTESDAYTDSAANRVAAVTHQTGRASLGVTGYYNGLSHGTSRLTPYLGLAVDHYATDGGKTAFEGTSARLRVGADWQLGRNAALNAEIATSGLGQDDYRATSAALAVELRF